MKRYHGYLDSQYKDGGGVFFSSFEIISLAFDKDVEEWVFSAKGRDNTDIAADFKVGWRMSRQDFTKGVKIVFDFCEHFRPKEEACLYITRFNEYQNHCEILGEMEVLGWKVIIEGELDVFK
jgi:hypothetical protein